MEIEAPKCDRRYFALSYFASSQQRRHSKHISLVFHEVSECQQTQMRKRTKKSTRHEEEDNATTTAGRVQLSMSDK